MVWYNIILNQYQVGSGLLTFLINSFQYLKSFFNFVLRIY